MPHHRKNRIDQAIEAAGKAGAAEKVGKAGERIAGTKKTGFFEKGEAEIHASQSAM